MQSVMWGLRRLRKRARERRGFFSDCPHCLGNDRIYFDDLEYLCIWCLGAGECQYTYLIRHRCPADTRQKRGARDVAFV